MKRESRNWRLEISLALLALLFFGKPAAQGQTTYALDWFTIDGGGSTSTGGVYTLSGTLGQPDASTMSGGTYTIAGGFWSLNALVPTPPTLWLTVYYTATNTVVICWPSAGSAGWVLERNGDLNPANWTDEPTPPADDGTTRSVTVSPPLGNRFYRLKKP